MQPDELVVVRLDKGATVVRYLERAGSLAKVALGRNRQAKLPLDRVILETGIVLTSPNQLEKHRTHFRELASCIDLHDVWDVITEESRSLDLGSLAELYWGSSRTMVEKVALLLYLDQNSDYFKQLGDNYIPLSRSDVQEIRARRKRSAENKKEEEILVGKLSEGNLPKPLTDFQATLIQHIRSYAIYGDEYSRDKVARRFLEKIPGGTGDLQRWAFDVLVSVGIFSPDEPLELHRIGIPVEFMKETLDESFNTKTPSKNSIEIGRRDLTKFPAVTIDDINTEERDDAISLDVVNEDTLSYHLAIHIADVGALISYDGSIDQEAGRRMATLYLPEGTIGMLPTDFYKRLGSLEPRKIRLAMSLLVNVTVSGEILDWEITPSVIRCSASLTYEEADRIIQDESSPWYRMLSGIHQAALGLRRRREEYGAVNVDQPEMSVRALNHGEVEVKVLSRSSPSRQMISELMILYNSLMAEFCSKEKFPAAYRYQAAPDLTGLPFDPGDTVEVASLTDAEKTLQLHQVVKRFRPAETDTIPAPHGGLGVPAYIQASSPLRRYPDMVMQRQIGHFLCSGRPLYSIEAVSSMIYRAEVQFRDLAGLEEQRKRYWFLRYLQQSRLKGSNIRDSADVFTAIVLENDFGRRALLQLVEFPYKIRVELQRTHVPGDTVTLKLKGVDLWRRIGHFVWVPGI